MATLDISGKARVGKGIGRFFKRFKASMREVFGRKRLEDLILAATLARFEPEGTSPTAQKSPERVPWVPITDYTARNRRQNTNRSQALVDTGALRDAIKITRTNLKRVVGENTRRATARVGIPVTSPQYEKGIRMQDGYTKPGRGGVMIEIPARPFIGLDPRTISAVGRFIDRAFGRVLA